METPNPLLSGRDVYLQKGEEYIYTVNLKWVGEGPLWLPGHYDQKGTCIILWEHCNVSNSGIQPFPNISLFLTALGSLAGFSRLFGSSPRTQYNHISKPSSIIPRSLLLPGISSLSSPWAFPACAQRGAHSVGDMVGEGRGSPSWMWPSFLRDTETAHLVSKCAAITKREKEGLQFATEKGAARGLQSVVDEVTGCTVGTPHPVNRL